MRNKFQALLAAACLAASAGAAGAGTSQAHCHLVLTQHRTGLELARILMLQRPVQFSVEFIHSVLGTRVMDLYEMRSDGSKWQAHLIEERFSGQGYGLPYAATSPGERYERVGDEWRLTLDRVIDPLVQLPLPEQQIDLVWQGGRIRLGSLSASSILITLEGCKAPG